MTHRSGKKNYQEPIYKDVVKQLQERGVPDQIVHRGFNGNQDTTIKRTLELRPFPIVIGVPMDELMFSKFFSNFICIDFMSWDMFVTTQDTFVVEGRNYIHDRFLEMTNANYLFMLDSDVLPPPNVIDRLLRHNLPVVGGYYRKKEHFIIKDVKGKEMDYQRPTVYDYKGFNETAQKFDWTARLEAGKGLEEVDGIGAGCLMLRRDVCEKIGKSPFSLLYGGEDLTFCRKITGAGYKIVVDWDLPCGHSGVFFV